MLQLTLPISGEVPPRRGGLSRRKAFTRRRPTGVEPVISEVSRASASAHSYVVVKVKGETAENAIAVQVVIP